MIDEKRIRARVISVITELIKSPKIYKKSDFATRFNCHADTIRDDFAELENAGFKIGFTKDYRYFIDYTASFTNLQKELYFTEEERDTLKEVVSKHVTSEVRRRQLYRKIESLLDVTKISNLVLNNVHLDKINLLQKARDEKKVVTLINYRSSSSKTIEDRMVEPHYINPKENFILAYCYKRKKEMTFKITRTERIRVLENSWEQEGSLQNVGSADAFGIVSKKLLPLHVRLNVSAANYLIERFPGTDAYCRPNPSSENLFDLECEVNDGFLGISNFLIGYHEHIEEILSPPELIGHLNEKVKKISF